jgi:ubiquinone/menaquinone biosynthesis C-methylase UbiE
MSTESDLPKAHRVCPWWLGYLLASPIRKLWQDPRKILAPFVQEGQKVLEPGPGMGFFTLELARRVGPKGLVFAVDVQQKMLDGLQRRASRTKLAERIHLRLASPDSMNISDLAGCVDFILAFAVVHEMPDAGRFFQQASAAAKPSAVMLLVEPDGHVTQADFEKELRLAGQAGFEAVAQPDLKGSLTAIFKKKGPA